MLDIIIPTINPLNDLINCINSICKYISNLSLIHIIIINDKSKYQEDYQKINKLYSNINITLINNEERLGPGPSRNKGIKVGNNPYITFIDSDDEIKENILNYCNPNFDLVTTTVKIGLPDMMFEDAKTPLTGVHGLIIKRKIINKYNLYFPNLKYTTEDTIFRLCAFGIIPESKQRHLSKTFYKFNLNPNSNFFHNYSEKAVLGLDFKILDLRDPTIWINNLCQYLDTLIINEVKNNPQWNNMILSQILPFLILENLDCFYLFTIIIKKYLNLQKINFKSNKDVGYLLFFCDYFFDIENSYLVFNNKNDIDLSKLFIEIKKSNIYNFLINNFNTTLKLYFSIDNLNKLYNIYYLKSAQKSNDQ